MIEFPKVDSFSIHAVDAAANDLRLRYGVGLAAFVATFDLRIEKVLLVQLGDYARANFGGNPWTLPGGRIEDFEKATTGACREVAEEARCIIAPPQLKLAAWFYRPYICNQHGNGEVITLFGATSTFTKRPQPSPPETINAGVFSFDYAKWLSVPATGTGQELQPLRRHWIYWTYLSRRALDEGSDCVTEWIYDSAADMCLPPWKSD